MPPTAPATSAPVLDPPPTVSGAATLPYDVPAPARWSLADLARREPTRLAWLLAAIAYAVPGFIQPFLDRLSMPHDAVYNGVTYLMFSGTSPIGQRLMGLLGVVGTFNTAACLILVAVAVLPRDAFFAPLVAVGRRLYRYAVALPLYALVLANLPRPVSNLVYALTAHVHWNLTPTIARLEAPLIEAFQAHLASPGLSVLASDFYSILWLLPTGFVGFLLVARDRPRALNVSIVAFACTSILAVPFFVLLPIFDPWSTNALYGAVGATTHIRYLYSHADPAALTFVNRRLHWAAGACLPSLHIAFPLVLALVFRAEGMRRLSRFMGVVAAITAFVVVYLGRHWLIDIAAAVVFSIAMARLAARVPFDVILGPRGGWTTWHAVRAAHADASDDAESNVGWLSGVFFVSGLAALLYQIVWQRTLFGIIGLNIESVTLVVTAFMLGLGVGSLIGGAVSERPGAPLPLLFAAAETGVGLFGFASLHLFDLVGRATLTMSSAGTAACTFLMLLPPTILMGATLPLLVAHHVREQGNVGQAVGRLYFMNTLGSAAAAVLAGVLLLGHLGQSGTVQAAALLNLAVGALVVARTRGVRPADRAEAR